MSTPAETGAYHLPRLIRNDLPNWAALLSPIFEKSKPGIRLDRISGLREAVEALLIKPDLSAALGGREWQCVRAIAFDKSPENNWSLGWHQDRTIAVSSREHLSGFSNWTCKSGIWHVEPPAEVMASMKTLRLHFDPVDETNGSLAVIKGSHRLGKMTEPEVMVASEAGPEIGCDADRGDAWLYCTPIIHGSNSSTSDCQRRVLQLDLADFELPPPLVWQGI